MVPAWPARCLRWSPYVHSALAAGTTIGSASFNGRRMRFGCWRSLLMTCRVGERTLPQARILARRRGSSPRGVGNLRKLEGRSQRPSDPRRWRFWIEVSRNFSGELLAFPPDRQRYPRPLARNGKQHLTLPVCVCWRNPPHSSDAAATGAAPAPAASARRPRSSKIEIGAAAVQSSGRIRAARRRLARARKRTKSVNAIRLR